MPAINTFGSASARSFGLLSSSAVYTPTLSYIAAYTGGGGSFGSINQSVDIGTATSDRIVLVIINVQNNAASTISSVTIGGISASIFTPSTTNGINNSTIIAQAKVTTGTTATVTASVSPNSAYWGISVYTLTRYNSAIPVWTGTYSSGGTSVSTMQVDVTSKIENSVGLFFASNYTGRDATFTWSNATRDTSQTSLPIYSTARLDPLSSGSFPVFVSASRSGSSSILSGFIWY